MSIRATALALCGLLALPTLLACNGNAPPPTVATTASTAAAPAAPAPAPTTPAAPAANKAGAGGEVSLLPAVNGPVPAKEPPLTQEEIDLIAMDPATLTPEMRKKRAFALRRKILQNPDSPTARQLEAMRLAADRGELDAQLPGKTRDVTLHARTPADPKPDPPKTERPQTAPAP